MKRSADFRLTFRFDLPPEMLIDIPQDIQLSVPPGRVKYIDWWIQRLNFLASHPHVREEHRAICAVIGHEASGEQFMTNPPIDVCRWCADEYRQSTNAVDPSAQPTGTPTPRDD